jgi:hypothetical protein
VGLLALCMLIGLYLGYVRQVTGQDIGERPLLMLAAVLGLIGAQFFVIGLIAELLARVYYETQQKPIYAVREEVGAPAAPEAAEGSPVDTVR